MRRTLIMVGLLGVLFLLAGSSGWLWLHQAPQLDPVLRGITPGLTIGQVEQRLGRALTPFVSCTGNRYYIEVPGDFRYGQTTYLEMVTSPHSYDVATQQITTCAHADEICRQVYIQRWSKIEWINLQPWACSLLGHEDQ